MAISFKISSINLRFLIPLDFGENNSTENVEEVVSKSSITEGLDGLNLFPTVFEDTQDQIADEMNGLNLQELEPEDSDQNKSAAKAFEQTSLKISNNQTDLVTPTKIEPEQIDTKSQSVQEEKEPVNTSNQTTEADNFPMWEILSDSAVQFFKSANESENNFRYKYTSHEMIDDKLYLNDHLNGDPTLFERNRDNQQLEDLKKEDKLQHKKDDKNKT